MKKSPDAFRTISEVSEWLDTPAHVLRFWESRFTQVKPVKRAGGRRYYRPADMQLLGGIKRLLHEDGLTIRGVQKILREEGLLVVTALSAPLPGGEGVEPVGDEAPPPRPAPNVPPLQATPRTNIAPADMAQDAPEAPMLEDAQDETEASIVPFTEHETARDRTAGDPPGLFQRAAPNADKPPAAEPPESPPIHHTPQAAPDTNADPAPDQGPVTAAPVPQTPPTPEAPAPAPPQDSTVPTDPAQQPAALTGTGCHDETPGAPPPDDNAATLAPTPAAPENPAPEESAPEPDAGLTGTQPPGELAATALPASFAPDVPGGPEIPAPIAAPVPLGAELPAADPADDDSAFAPVVPPLRTRLRSPAVHRALRDDPDHLVAALDLLGKLAVRMDENRLH